MTADLDEVRSSLSPLTGVPGDYDSLLQAIGDARFVLLGEASHGTHEFYRQRALVTRRLVEDKHFAAVAVEGDWPDAPRFLLASAAPSPARCERAGWNGPSASSTGPGPSG